MLTVTMSNKSIARYIDAINGAVSAAARAMQEQQGSMYSAADYIGRKTRLLAACEDYTRVLGLSAQGIYNPAAILADACYMRAVRCAAGEFKALSGAAFRKWVKEFTSVHLGVTIEKPEPANKAPRQVKVDAEELAAFRAWKAEQK